ncbi:hypothetical protein ACWZHB_01055 [Nocardia sp. FBN12]|uniref:hypothetical protein n=1 Tax=Nocardia sp. FBN12 TaxID=3419766 RepID=UPI003CFC75C0
MTQRALRAICALNTDRVSSWQVWERLLMTTRAELDGWTVPAVVDWTNSVEDPVHLILSACALHKASRVYLPRIEHLPQGALPRLRAKVSVFTVEPDHCYEISTVQEGCLSE